MTTLIALMEYVDELEDSIGEKDIQLKKSKRKIKQLKRKIKDYKSIIKTSSTNTFAKMLDYAMKANGFKSKWKTGVSNDRLDD